MQQPFLSGSSPLMWGHQRGGGTRLFPFLEIAVSIRPSRFCASFQSTSLRLRVAPRLLLQLQKLGFSTRTSSPACAMRMKLIFILSVSFCAAQGSELGVRDEGEQNGHCSDPSPFCLLYVKLFFSHLQLTEWTLVGAVTSDLRTLEIFHHGAGQRSAATSSWNCAAWLPTVRRHFMFS